MSPQEYPAALKVYCVLKIILIPALKGHAWEKPESIFIDLWQAHRGLSSSSLLMAAHTDCRDYGTAIPIPKPWTWDHFVPLEWSKWPLPGEDIGTEMVFDEAVFV